MNKNRVKILMSIFFILLVQLIFAKDTIGKWEKIYQQIVENTNRKSLEKDLFENATNVFQKFLTYDVVQDENLKEKIIENTNKKIKEIIQVNCTSRKKGQEVMYEIQMKKKINNLSDEESILVLDVIFNLNNSSRIIYNNKKRILSWQTKKRVKWMRKKLIKNIKNKKKYNILEKKVIAFYTSSK